MQRKMPSILITGGDLEQRAETARRMAAELLGQDALKLDTQPDFLEILPHPGISIDDVRLLTKLFSRKPYQSDHTVAILSEFQKATPEAQNASLKTLEEPAPFATIILTATNRDAVLPTVASRCREVTILPKQKKTGGGDNTNHRLKEILTLNRKERLKLIEELSLPRQECLTLVEDLIRTAEEQLRQNPDQKQNLVAFLRAAQIAQKDITANVDIRLALANLLLSLH